MNTIEQFEVSGSHYEVGLAIGIRFADAIHRLFDNYDRLQNQLLPFYHTADGGRYYQSFLRLHRTRFPQYVAELEGLAEGAKRAFEEIFLVNLRGEFSGLIQLQSPSGTPADQNGRGCTDCLVLTPDAALIGHNEDGTPASLGNMYVVRVAVDGQPGFRALCYPGFLPGNAFGVNDFGIIHTVNHVAPRQVRVGLGRHFMARSLFDAASLDEAVRRVTVSGRAAGFNYNIGSLSERRVVSVQVAPEQHHVHEVQGYYLHTNHYQGSFDVEQEIEPSSRTRLIRARTLCQERPPTEATHVLALLGDQTDPDYPIHRDATLPDIDATLCTALFDLDNRQLRIYWDHPVRQPQKYIGFDL